MEKEIPVASIRKPADKPSPVGFRPKNRIGPTNRGNFDSRLAKKRRNEAVDRHNLLKDKKQYLNIQYKITRKLLKSATPSKTIIAQARRLSRLVKSSNEEMSELELITDQDIPIALFDKQPDNPTPLKFGPERRFGPVDRREYDGPEINDQNVSLPVADSGLLTA